MILDEKQELTCILCPNGCALYVCAADGAQISVTGAKCRKGQAYGRQEIQNPQRSLTTSAAVVHGESPLVSIRLTRPVAKDKIPALMSEIKTWRLEAPITAGQILCVHILGLDSDVIATKSIARKPAG